MEVLKSICQENCAQCGDPPCYDVDKRSWREGRGGANACDECLAELEDMRPGAAAQFRKPEELDPDAVVRPLL